IVGAGDKSYEAEIRLGFSTDTDDADGQPLGTPVTTLPDDAAVKAAVGAFAGTFDQLPPSHSARKVGGRKAYDIARRDERVVLSPASVTVRSLDRVTRLGDRVSLRVTATTGFYVRALARDLGKALGCGGHLTALRRTRCGTFDVVAALPLEVAERL